ncbi:(d)CMP kinase [Thermohalobacter berrensis]|uniref:Cytidylate kinase n=1 Tax=Thermohalobacter berrensis TaxID=99594 RepID=A0A419TAP2_9FIRM|nr:(d)CMP kinase [Thermohalobacter berrensis]RKD34522.1 cytidylate kinase [Thermohalobacter berrensis]
MKKISIAIDGPAGAGKSTIAKIISKKLKITYIDTGAMYRALTLKLLDNKINLDDINSIKKILTNTTIDFKNNNIYLDGKIVNEQIRTNKVNNNVSKVAKIKEVREELVKKQRQIACNKSVVMDGRDIGTYVLPYATFKFFITASVEERGKRRYKDLIKKEKDITLEKVIEEIKIRDKIDSTRELSPLKMSKDAILIDTTYKTIEETVNEILTYIKEGR